MTDFAQFITTVLSSGALVLQIALVVLAVLYVKNKNHTFFKWISKNVLVIASVLVFSATTGSLLYSEIIGFDPCKLCWIQRAFIFPQLVVLALAMYKKDTSVVPYLFAFSVIGALAALYHSVSQFTGISLIDCTAVGGECSKIYFATFGYITIPVLSLTIFASLAFVYWIKENAHV